MSLTIDQQDTIYLRLRRAQAIMDLIGLAALASVDKRTISAAVYLSFELIEEAHEIIEAACKPVAMSKRRRTA